MREHQRFCLSSRQRCDEVRIRLIAVDALPLYSFGGKDVRHPVCSEGYVTRWVRRNDPQIIAQKIDYFRR